MTDVRLMPNHIGSLFKPRPPLKYKEPCDYDPAHRATRPVSGLTDFLQFMNQPDESSNYTPTETAMQRIKRERLQKQEKHARILDERLKNWDPKNDLHIRGSPECTLFIARLSYKATEEDLQREFERYGPIERVRVVKTQEGKPRGYGFVVFERDRDMKIALRESRDKVILGRRIITDYERGRRDAHFKPRSLGGGLGGRHYTKQRSSRRPEGGGMNNRFSGRGGGRFGGGGPRRRGDDKPRFRDRDDRRGGGYRDGDRKDRDRDREREQRDRERERRVERDWNRGGGASNGGHDSKDRYRRW